MELNTLILQKAISYAKPADLVKNTIIKFSLDTPRIRFVPLCGKQQPQNYQWKAIL
jgi:hypothetical protein